MMLPDQVSPSPPSSSFRIKADVTGRSSDTCPGEVKMMLTCDLSGADEQRRQVVVILTLFQSER